MQARLPRALAYLVVATGFLLRVQGLAFQSFWRDEVDALRFALTQTVTSLSQIGWNGPLYTRALRLWLEMSGTGEFTARFSSVLPAVAVLPLIYWVGKRLSGERVGLVAMALAGFSPYLVWYAQELKMYSLLGFLGVASYAALLAALRDGGLRRWALYVGLTSIIPYVHILGVLLIPAQVVGVILARRTLGERWRAFAVSLAVMVLPYIPLGLWQARLLASAFQTGHPYYPLPNMLSILARGWTLGIVASSRTWLLLAFGLPLLGLLIPGRDVRSRSGMAVPLAWLLVPVALIYLISLRSPLFTDRYLIASLPALLLLLAWGVISLLDRRRVLGLALLGGMLLASGYGIALQDTYSIKTDARGAADIIRAGWQPGDVMVLQIPYLQHSMEHYLGPGYEVVEGPYTNYGLRPEEVDTYFRLGLSGHPRAWLMLSEAEMWDTRGLTLRWFREHTLVLQEWELARVHLLLIQVR